MQGAIHAREYMTPLVMMSQLEYALAFYDTGHYNYKSVKDMLKKVAIHFVPMTNPDGVTLSQFGIDAIRSDSLKPVSYTHLDVYKRQSQTPCRPWKTSAERQRQLPVRSQKRKSMPQK